MNSFEHTRYFIEGQIQTKRMLLAAGANRIIDPGNQKVSAVVSEIRHQAKEKLGAALKPKYGDLLEEDIYSYGNTLTSYPSHHLDELQMADLAWVMRKNCSGYIMDKFPNFAITSNGCFTMVKSFQSNFFRGK